MTETDLGGYISGKIGCFLNDTRVRAGLSVEKAAKNLKYRSISTLENYESGKIGIPCRELVRVIDSYLCSRMETQNFLLELQMEIWHGRKQR